MIRQRFPLARLDAALAREVLRLRVRYQLSLDEFRGLYVSDEQVDALLNRAPTLPPEWAALPESATASGNRRTPASRSGLDDAAIDVLLLALAPDLDPAYATLIAYLNDDVRRRWPTADLARRLFGDTAALDPAGPLVVPGLLLPIETTERLAAPLSEFAPNPVLTAHLTGAGLPPNRGLAQQPEVAADPGPLAGLLPMLEAGHRPLVLLIGSRADNRTALVRTLNRSVVHVKPAPPMRRRGSATASSPRG